MAAEGSAGSREKRVRRELHLTEALVAQVFREVADPGPDPTLRELEDHEFEAFAREILHQKGEWPLWIFAYGSLIWKPVFTHVEERRCHAFGWRRAYCLGDQRWRACPETPGLILCLDRGGSCQGMAYRLPEEGIFDQMLALLYREAAYDGDFDSIRWLPVHAGADRVCALTFYAAPTSDPEYMALPMEVQAARLARAVGHLGSAAEYLRNTVLHLEEIGIHDSYLWQLQRLVAEEIAQMGGG